MRFIAVWRFAVRPEKVDDFLAAYGPDGLWVQLFRTAEGFISTQLLRDDLQDGSFLTIDTWVSTNAYRAFRTRFAAEYASADQACSEFCDHEDLVAEGEMASSPFQS